MPFHTHSASRSSLISPLESKAKPCFGLLLAAGFSRRFGDDKRLQPLPSNTLEKPSDPPGTERSLQEVKTSSTPLGLATVNNWLRACAGNNKLEHLYVVTRPGDEFSERLQQFLADCAQNSTSTLIAASEAKRGMGHTLAQAVAQIPQGPLIVGLADMPYVQASTIQALVCALAHSRTNSVVQPAYKSRPGNPVGFGINLRQALVNSRGDEGARAQVREARAADRLLVVDVDDAGILYDIDTPADIRHTEFSSKNQQ